MKNKSTFFKNASRILFLTGIISVLLPGVLLLNGCGNKTESPDDTKKVSDENTDDGKDDADSNNDGNDADKADDSSNDSTNDSDDTGSDNDNIPVITPNFFVKVLDRFTLLENESSAYEFYFESLNPVSSLQIYDTSTQNSDLNTYVELYKSMIVDSYGILENEINISKISDSEHDGCYYVTYPYTTDGIEYIVVNYIICDEGQILIISESGLYKDKDVFESEIKQIADSVEYMGTFRLPDEDDYPFTVENDIIRVTINKGFYCLSISDIYSEDKSEYITDSQSISIRYSAADNYDKGITSKFIISLSLNQDIPASEQAESLYNNYLDGELMDNPTINEVKLVDIISTESGKSKEIDPALADVTAYVVSGSVEDTNFSVENFYFETNGQIYCLKIAYPYEDYATRDELREILCSVEFLTED
ncbi:MAG: hypothetical protein ACI39R_02775 [Lachnospiraceae bacterium]